MDARPASSPASASSGTGPASPAPPWKTALLWLALAACLHPAVDPGLGLAGGMILAVTGLIAPGTRRRKWATRLIQFAVIVLGLTMDLRQVLHAGLSGMGFAAGTIAGTFILGTLVGRLLRTDSTITTLINSGTAICGGSAIAAVGSVIGATSAQMSVALATVFVLNGIALYLFPPLGHWLHLTPTQFGTWAAVAIHDVSSVVGAAARFSPDALESATAVKLARALWIIPLSMLAAWRFRDTSAAAKSRPKAPIFIGLFLVACVARELVPQLGEYQDAIRTIGKRGMTMGLLLIGANLSLPAIKAVGWRPMVLGVVLWIAITLAALLVVRSTIA
ncbi:MAG: putative sulfate exporter family transporter [Phycisphaerales bacterium]|nr:putative sulfate exporter family transporter [Phycisphaerales bacterium]